MAKETTAEETPSRRLCVATDPDGSPCIDSGIYSYEITVTGPWGVWVGGDVHGVGHGLCDRHRQSFMANEKMVIDQLLVQLHRSTGFEGKGRTTGGYKIEWLQVN